MMTKVLMKTRSFMPLDELGKVHRYNITIVTMPEFFYAEATSVIDFLIAVYGKEQFLEFCRRLRDLRVDQDWTVALFETYGFESLSDVNEKWMKFLSN